MRVLPFLSDADVLSATPRVEAHLASGGLLAYPTETVYGLGSRIQVADLAALATLTERPSDKPFLVLVADMKMALDCGLVFTAEANRLADSFWPGPLTLVLVGSDSVFPDVLRGTQGGVAVRWSSHAATGRLIQALGRPISSTSANVSGRPPLPDVEGIIAEFEGPANSGDLLVLDGGTLSDGPSSTLVDCTFSKPRLLREGAISSHRIWESLEEVVD